MYQNALRVDYKYIYFLLRNGGHLCPWIAAEIELAPLCFIDKSDYLPVNIDR